MRIDKFLSMQGIASRKEAGRAAKSGGVTVDGEVVRDLSRHIDPNVQRVCYMGEPVAYSEFVYIMLNKPAGYVSATDDKSLPFVTELLEERYRKMELFPVGRLDKDTVGLMILTNDGVLAHRVLSPRHHVEKKYYFEADEPLPGSVAEDFREGIVLRDGYECKSAEIELNPDCKSGFITLTEGKYHQIKRMVASFNNRVTYLERVSFGGITLDGALARGEWRLLTDCEISLLRAQNN